MRTPDALLAALVLLPALAGCMQAAPAAPPSGPSWPPGRIELTQCTGFAGTSVPSPSAAAPGQAPVGWEPTNPAAPAWSAVGGLDCRRIRVGPYERGPVRIVWDGHTNANPPVRCTAQQAPLTQSLVLNAFLVNDAQVAADLRDRYGMPALFADVQVQATAPLLQQEWTWAPPGQPASTLTVRSDGGNQSYEGADRFWWPRGAGLGQLDVAYTRSGSQFSPLPSQGTMRPPMLLPPPAGHFVGNLAHFPTLAGEGRVTLYTDFLCAHPEPVP
jgi:hypothetical protein